jgi:hypothetical protein
LDLFIFNLKKFPIFKKYNFYNFGHDIGSFHFVATPVLIVLYVLITDAPDEIPNSRFLSLIRKLSQGA